MDEFFKIWTRIRNQHPRKSPNTNFHKNWKFLENPFRHFEFRNTDSEFEINNPKTHSKQFSCNSKNFQNFGPPYWNRHFEFFKSDGRFLTRIPEDPYIKISIKIRNFPKFPPYWIHHFEFRKSDSVFKIDHAKTQCTQILIKIHQFSIFWIAIFWKSDRGFVISVPDKSHIQIWIKIEKFRNFDPPFWISKIWPIDEK